MNLDRIRERLAGGFRPFALETSGGKCYEVPHPEFLAIGRGVVVVLGSNDSVNTIAALHIVGLDDLPAQPKRRGPGSR
ncbi:MAG: hypothetical protein KIT22_06240 [Verrucomicrobiae bacterium]|nr:hypothetical protein [Verrucomicrobiae bacterium]